MTGLPSDRHVRAATKPAGPTRTTRVYVPPIGLTGEGAVERTFVTEIHIDRDPDDVMAFLRSPENWLSFAQGVVDCEPRGEVLDVGTVGSWTRKQGRMTQVNRFEVLELDPAGKLVMRVEAGGFSTDDRTELRRASNGTDATFTEVMTATGLPSQAMLLLFAPMIRSNLKRTYAKLKQVVESS